MTELIRSWHLGAASSPAPARKAIPPVRSLGFGPSGQQPLVQRCGATPCDCPGQMEPPEPGEQIAAAPGGGERQPAGEEANVQRACGPRVGGTTCLGSSEEFVPSATPPFRFDRNCDTLKPREEGRLKALGSAAARSGGILEAHGYASIEGDPTFNAKLSCARAERVGSVLEGQGAVIADLQSHGAATGDRDLHRSVVVRRARPRPGPPPVPGPPGPPPCPALPTATPGACSARHTAYCDAARCRSTNSWLGCVCTASGQICDAVDGFGFTGAQGNLLAACALASGAPGGPINAKGRWFESANRCIWGHWRAAFDAIHDPAIPVPSGLTPEWAAAVATCRTSGLGSSDCCRAHVRAEQTAIDACLPYDSRRFGRLPTDVPGARICSSIVAAAAPGPAFSGDFGSVADRIAYGIGRCCP